MHKLSSLLVDVDRYEIASYEDLIEQWLFNSAYNTILEQKDSRKRSQFEIKDSADVYLSEYFDILLDTLYKKAAHYCNWLRENNPYYIAPPNNTYTINIYNKETVVTPELALFVELMQYVEKLKHYQQEFEMSVDLYTEDYTSDNNWYFTSFAVLRNGEIIRILDAEELEDLNRILYNLDCDSYELDYVDDWDLFELLLPVSEKDRWEFIRKYLVYISDHKESGDKEDSKSLDDLRDKVSNYSLETLLNEFPTNVNKMAIVNSFLFMKRIILENPKDVTEEIFNSVNPYGELYSFEQLLEKMIGRSLEKIVPMHLVDNSLKAKMQTIKSLQYCNYPPFSVLYQSPNGNWSNFDYRQENEKLDVDNNAAIVFFDVHY